MSLFPRPLLCEYTANAPSSQRPHNPRRQAQSATFPVLSHHSHHGAHSTQMTQEMTKLLSQLWVPQPHSAITGAGDLQSEGTGISPGHPSSIFLCHNIMRGTGSSPMSSRGSPGAQPWLLHSTLSNLDSITSLSCGFLFLNY